MPTPANMRRCRKDGEGEDGKGCYIDERVYHDGQLPDVDQTNVMTDSGVSERGLVGYTRSKGDGERCRVKVER